MSACSALSDLEAERAKASFPIAELTHVLDGDAQLTALNARLSKIASSDAVLSSWKRDEQRGVPRTSTLRHDEVMHRLHRCAQLAEKHDLDAMESLQLKVRASSTVHTYMHTSTFYNSSVVNFSLKVFAVLPVIISSKTKNLVILAGDDRVVVGT